MAIIGIVAVDRQGAIGKGGGLPWHFAADLKFFKAQTTGNVCVMGARTWATLRKPLPNRLNIVLTSRTEIAPQPSVLVLRDKLSVLSLKSYLACDIFIIGGRQVYDAFMPDIDRWLVTEIPLTVEGADTFMPADFLDGFEQYDTLPLDDNLPVKFYRRV